MVITQQRVFYAGDALTPDYPYYVSRQADQEALDAFIYNTKSIYIRAQRQMGKTSFLWRFATELSKLEWCCCTVDLSTFKKGVITYVFDRLLREIFYELKYRKGNFVVPLLILNNELQAL